MKEKKKTSFRISWVMAIMAAVLTFWGQYARAAEDEELAVEQGAPTGDDVIYVSDPVDLSEDLLAWGGLLPSREAEYGNLGLTKATDKGASTAEQLKNTIYQGIREWKTQINIYQYQIRTENANTDFWPCIADILNERADTFYVSNGFSYSYTTSGYIYDLYVSYSDKYTEADVQDFYHAADKIVSQITPDMTDEQKLLYIHDYLVTHCQYDVSVFTDSLNAKYNAYNVLIEHCAVCQGYSEAFKYLCDAVGIECYVVTSDEINHAWNLVKLDGVYYFIDCTWDDPLASLTEFFYEGYCQHRNFLRSREGIVNDAGHNNLENDPNWTIEKADWIATTIGSDVTNYAATAASEKYDAYYWANVCTAIPQIGNLCAYADSSDRTNVYLRTTAGKEQKIGISGGYWPYVEMPGYNYTTSFASFVKVGDNFYFSTKDTIYRLTTSGVKTAVYTLTDAEKEIGWIYGLIADGQTITYSLGQKMAQSSFTQKQLYLGEPAVIKYALAEFTGKIGVAFQVQLPDWILQDENAYVEFSRGGKIYTQKVSDAKKETVDGDVTVYRFTLYIVAKEYADNINFRIFTGEGVPVSLKGTLSDFTSTGVNYSLKQYADYIMANPGKFGADAVELAETLEQYCNAARIHFQYNNAGLTRNSALDAVTTASFGNCDPVVTGNLPAGITDRNMKVAFEADNALKVFFTYASGVKPEDYEYYVDGQKVDVTRDGNEYYIAARNLPAKYLDKPHTFIVKDATTTCTMQLSVMSYAKILIGASGYSETEKDLGRVLYLYNQAARKYFKITETY